jgi:hypothetical protein
MPNHKPLENFGALVTQLEIEQIPFRKDEDEPILNIPTRLLEKESLLQIRWEPIQGIIQFIQVLPLIVPEKQREAVMLLINRINFSLPVLGFTLNEKTGVLTYRTQAFLNENKAILPGLIGALIALSIRNSEQFLTQLQASATLSSINHSTRQFDIR